MSIYLDWYEQKLPPSYFFVNFASMSFYLDLYHKKNIYLMSIYLDWYEQKLPPFYFFLNIASMSFYLDLTINWMTGAMKNYFI